MADDGRPKNRILSRVGVKDQRPLGIPWPGSELREASIRRGAKVGISGSQAEIFGTSGILPVLTHFPATSLLSVGKLGSYHR
jgi:hypothetical protein